MECRIIERRKTLVGSQVVSIADNTYESAYATATMYGRSYGVTADFHDYRITRQDDKWCVTDCGDILFSCGSSNGAIAAFRCYAKRKPMYDEILDVYR